MSELRRFNAGTVHYLDFDGMAPIDPEMRKGRPVIVISPRNRREDDLVVVVPISTVPSTTYKRHVVQIRHSELQHETWAKCDMPITVSIERLLPYRRPKYERQNMPPPNVEISGTELRQVREAVIRSIGAEDVLRRLSVEREQRRALREARLEDI
ncbi:MAG: type II toxin-antitoxin system PemK/MazF family toxin [Pseudomonadota bacterium]